MNKSLKEKVLGDINELSDFERNVVEMVKIDLMYDRSFCKLKNINYIHVDDYQNEMSIYAYLILYGEKNE